MTHKDEGMSADEAREISQDHDEHTNRVPGRLIEKGIVKP
jgi:hypothetical protein